MILLRFAWAILRDKPEIILVGHILPTLLAVIARSLSRNVRHVLFVHGVEAWENPPIRSEPAHCSNLRGEFPTERSELLVHAQQVCLHQSFDRPMTHVTDQSGLSGSGRALF